MQNKIIANNNNFFSSFKKKLFFLIKNVICNDKMTNFAPRIGIEL